MQNRQKSNAKTKQNTFVHFMSNIFLNVKFTAVKFTTTWQTIGKKE